jgi:hypothetical protein
MVAPELKPQYFKKKKENSKTLIQTYRTRILMVGPSHLCFKFSNNQSRTFIGPHLFRFLTTLQQVIYFPSLSFRT